MISLLSMVWFTKKTSIFQTMIHTLKCRFPSIPPGKRRDLDLTFDLRGIEDPGQERMTVTMRLESHCSRVTQDNNANMASNTNVR